MHRKNVFLLLYLMAHLFLVGCAKKTMVVLLPDPDGKVGQVQVTTDAGSVDISQAQQATVVDGRSSVPATPRAVSDDDIARNFADAIGILPDPPQHFILYFKLDSTKLTSASMKLMPEVLRTIELRNSQNISVVGHTDTAGDKAYNLKLSQRRAAAVAAVLKAKGVEESQIHSTSHGEENPLIKTADNVSEPRNRRVEVVVR